MTFAVDCQECIDAIHASLAIISQFLYLKEKCYIAVPTGAVPAMKPEATAMGISARWPLENGSDRWLHRPRCLVGK